ncbi:MAG: type II toxin-antitoxin system RelE/ParE family toxin [Methylococcaceae bacterium]
MKKKFRITPRAQEDLKNIGRYTLRKWGVKQRNIYLHHFDNSFELLGYNPKIGRERADIKSGYYSYLQGQHVIFYTLNKEAIDVIGIPHQQMDILNYFN